MALSATRTTNGFELVGNLMPCVTNNPVEYELTPATTLAAGDMVVFTNNKITYAAANANNVVGVMAETFTATTNPSTAKTFGKVHANPFNVYRCSFADHGDYACSASTSLNTTTTIYSTYYGSMTASALVGCLVYLYEGPGSKAIRTITASSSSGTLTFIDPVGAQPTTATNFILLGSTGCPINVGTIGVDLKDANTIDADAVTTSAIGPLTVVALNPAELTMDVVIRRHWLNGFTT
jgi:hypothetical protein